MYHNLTTGETDENIDTVFDDAISWVTDRSGHLLFEWHMVSTLGEWGYGSSTSNVRLHYGRINDFILIRFDLGSVPLFCYASHNRCILHSKYDES